VRAGRMYTMVCRNARGGCVGVAMKETLAKP
jgi:hypothetical protein